MSEIAGKYTGYYSNEGKPVYYNEITGEFLSEKSVTLPYENMFVNVPSVYNGILFSEDEVREMLNEGNISPISAFFDLQSAIKEAEKRSSSLMEETPDLEVIYGLLSQ